MCAVQQKRLASQGFEGHPRPTRGQASQASQGQGPTPKGVPSDGQGPTPKGVSLNGPCIRSAKRRTPVRPTGCTHCKAMQAQARSVGRAGAHAQKRFAEWAGLVRPAGLCRIVTLCMKFFGITQSLTARRTGSLIRPLMSISRDDVKKLCRFWGLPIYPDVTNQEIAFSRNRIRKQVLPALRLALNPQVDNVLSQSAEILLAERLHGDLLASKLPRASQPLRWLGAYHPAQAGYGPTNYLATRRIDDKAKAPYHGLPFSFEACEAYGPHAAWLRLPEMGRGEMIRKTCHEKKKCGRLLLQRSGWLFLPQVGGLFVDSAPGLARTLS